MVSRHDLYQQTQIQRQTVSWNLDTWDIEPFCYKQLVHTKIWLVLLWALIDL